MGKKKTAGNLGRSIIKDRFGKRTIPKGDSFLHTSELNDGYDWGRLNLQSVTEQSNLDDFLATAELAGTEFTAEKLNVKFVDPKGGTSLLSDVEKSRISKLHDEHRQLLRIPRRPQWDENTSAEELDQNEKAAFLSWRRELASLQEIEGIVMTPYEKSLDFWRQLWRVIERSDVIIQVVDARNPLLFRCQDVEEYVKEVSTDKQNLLLVNKADFLTEHQRRQWCKYFDNMGIKAVFWSALEESERQAKEVKEMEGNEEMEGDMVPDSASESNEEELSAVVSKRLCVEEESSVCVRNRLNGDEEETITSESKTLGGDEASAFSVSKRLDGDKEEYVTRVSKGLSGDNALDTSQSSTQSSLPLSTERKVFTNNMECKDTRQDFGDKDSVTENVDNDFCDKYGASPSLVTKETRLLSNEQQLTNSTEILSGPKLIKFLKHYHSGRKVQDDLTTIGMIGYPNVGKSSTINAILKMKKVPVSATPGRTKHFQTLYVDEDLMLCDCPGLVFPSFVCTKAELILNGVLPIDQMRDHVPPISLTCQYIPRDILELTYGINLPVPGEGEDPTRDPTAEELLSSYGHMRGYMTANGMPDCPRASRYILKDFVNGRLLFCQTPPGVDQKEFNSKTVSSVIMEKGKQFKQPTVKKPARQNKIDREFFKKVESTLHSKGVQGISKFARSQGLTGTEESKYGSTSSMAEKPWRKHHNRNKKEKLRRLYKEHDDD